MCVFLLGMNINRTSINASQYFLLQRQSNILFKYSCLIASDISNPIGILQQRYGAQPKQGEILQNDFEFSESLNE